MSKVTLYLFPGISKPARKAGDLGIDDVSCPYCDSGGSCKHLMAFIDPMNYDVGGRFHGLEKEFAYRINKAFLPLLKEGVGDPNWKSEEISELWQLARDNWTTGDEESDVDSDVLFRLISEVLQEVAEHSEIASQEEGFGAETEYTLVYDDDSQGVLERAIEALDLLLEDRRK